MKEEKAQNIFKECNTGELFSKDFKDSVKTENDSRKCVAEFFSKKKDKTPLKRKNPFPASPFPRGRGSFQQSGAGASQHSRSYSGRGFSSFRKKEYPSRGIYKQQSFGQQALSSRMVALSGPCSSSDRKLVQIKRGDITSSREDSKIPPELAINNKRPGYTKHRQRLGNPFRRNSYPKENTLSNKNEQGGGDGNRFGNRGHAEKRSNQTGNPKEGPVSEQYFCDTKRGGPVSSHNKFETTEQIYPLSSFQNGGIEGRKKSSPGRGFDVQVGSEGCIFFSSPQHKVSETGQVQVERETVRVPLLSFRPGTGPSDIHKVNESAYFHSKKIECTPSDISRRHLIDGLITGENSNGSGLGHVPFPPSRINYKHEEVCARAPEEIRVPGGCSGQPINDILYSSKESNKAEESLSKDIDFSTNNPEGVIFSGGKTESYSSSCYPSTSSTEISSTDMYSGPTSGTALRICSRDNQRRSLRVEMVGQQFDTVERKSPSPTTPRDGNLFRCSNIRGWGAVTHLGATGGLWTEEERNLHINVQELLAAELAILTFTKHLKPSSIHIKMDNTTALSYLTKIGGTKNLEMIKISKRIWGYLLDHGITITAEWIPSHLNVIADRESRNVQDSSEWMLSPQIFRRICQKMGTPNIDLFASRISH